MALSLTVGAGHPLIDASRNRTCIVARKVQTNIRTLTKSRTPRANTLAIDLEIDNIVRCFEDSDDSSLDSPKGPRRGSRMTLRHRLTGA